MKVGYDSFVICGLYCCLGARVGIGGVNDKAWKKGSIQSFLTEIIFLIKSQIFEIKQSVQFIMNTTTFMWNNLILFLDNWWLCMNSPRDDGWL